MMELTDKNETQVNTKKLEDAKHEFNSDNQKSSGSGGHGISSDHPTS